MSLRALWAALGGSLLVLTITLIPLRSGGQRPPPRADQTDGGSPHDATDWVGALTEELERIDRRMPGDVGVFVKHLGEGRELQRGGERSWYLASTIKVPVAIAVLEKVAAGGLTLSEKVTLKDTDFIDGAGDLKLQPAGKRFTVAELLAKSIENSDSIATDMLIGLVGVDELNRRIQAWTGGGFGPITTIQQVRRDVYGALHPGAADLTSRDLMKLREAQAGEPRLRAFAEALGIARSELAADSFEAAFERYYATGKNSARLEAFASILEKLVRGELLTAEHTALLLKHMERITTGSRRIQAGLPPGASFAQKTGTQIRRACNVGVLNPRSGKDAVVVAACAAEFENLKQAEEALRGLGKAMHQAGLVQ
jgi:beta-lactamase class A